MNRYERLRQLMEQRRVDAIVLRRPANFAWYTGGADTKVDHVASEGVADLVVWADAELVRQCSGRRRRSRSTPSTTWSNATATGLAYELIDGRR